MTMNNDQYPRRDNDIIPPELCSTLGIKRDKILPAALAAGVTERLDVYTCLSWCENPASAPSWFTEVILADEVEKSLRGVSVHRPRAPKKPNERDDRFGASKDEFDHTIERLRTGAKLTPGDERRIEIMAFDLSKDMARGMRPDEITADGRAVLAHHGINPDDHSTWQIHAGRCRGDIGDTCQGYEDYERTQQMAAAEESKKVRRQWSDENAALMSSGSFEVGQTVLCWGSTVGVIVKKNKVTAKVELLGKGAASGTITTLNIKAHFLVPVTVLPPEEESTVRFKSVDGRERDGEVVEVNGVFARVRYFLANGAEREMWIDPSLLRGADAIDLPSGRTSGIDEDGNVVIGGSAPHRRPERVIQETPPPPLPEAPKVAMKETKKRSTPRRAARRESGPPQE